MLLKSFAICGGVGLFLLYPEVEFHRAFRTPSHDPTTINVVMLGDSHTEAVNWQILTGCQHVANRGVGGDTTEHILGRLDATLSTKPLAVFLMIGTNDAQRVSIDASTRNVRAIIERIRASGSRVILLAPPPRRDGRTPYTHPAAIEIPFSESDLGPDGIHLKKSGYRKWRDTIQSLVDRYCSR